MVPTVAAGYVSDVWRALPQQGDRARDGLRGLHDSWGDWGEEVLSDLEYAWAQLPEFGEALWLGLLGEGQEDSVRDILGLDIAEWVSRGWFTLAVQVSRATDRERVLLAGASQDLAWLRTSGDHSAQSLTEAETSAYEAFVPRWWMYLSQPVALSCYLQRPSRASRASERERFLRYLKEARLLLALRLHRDVTGHWPERLEELASDYLDWRPVDTIHGRRLHYRRQGAHWVVWLDDREELGPDGWEFGGTAFWSARCLMGDWQSRLHEVGSQAFFRDTPHLDDLLALLPPGAGEVEPGSEPPRPRMDELMMRRYGLLPP
jgi:hypothetical protein